MLNAVETCQHGEPHTGKFILLTVPKGMAEISAILDSTRNAIIMTYVMMRCTFSNYQLRWGGSVPARLALWLIDTQKIITAILAVPSVSGKGSSVGSY
jgi:hypothetical protein